MTSSQEKKPDLEQAWQHAVAALDLVAPPGVTLHRGVGGRTLSGPVATVEGFLCWLRVMSAPTPGGKVWEGAGLAAELIGDGVPRPCLLSEYTWGEGPVFQALLWERLSGTVVSATPDLTVPVKVEPGWWGGLRQALDALHEVPTPEGRQVFSQAFVHRIPDHIPETAETGIDTTVRKWVTAHGDLHWANLTDNPLSIIDWEGWGAAPAGYDAAVLHAYALPVAEIAAKVRQVFADVLDTDDGHLAHLIICAEIIQASERDELHARLAPYVKRFVSELLTSTSP
ncbi:phosphotransferase [Nocardiopsis sp. ATB16-24]|uniref:phosphotransferase n=1 Tax=Nocardiopsis sp. ATB16-24 TaxID=3019555 RepID=UPI0025540313|nr:phosphotransferase [Nocardiopsis sp. ATB16-24]